MKKRFRFFFTLLSVMIIGVGALSSCAAPPALNTVAGYTVRFHDNYRGDYAKREVEKGKTVTLPTEPARTGYAFKGWFLSHESDTTLSFEASTPIVNNLTVYAKWERDTSVNLVTFKYQNLRTEDSIVAINKGAVLSKPATPVYDENEMYAFVDWFTDADGITAYDFSQNINNDMTLYAGWVKAKAYLKLDYNYTASPAPEVKIVTIGEVVDSIDAPIREQYEFGDWYTARVGGMKFNIDEPITDDTVLFAHWKREYYSVSFDVNGAKLSAGIETDYSIKMDTSAVEIAATISEGMSYTGHLFTGWYTQKFDPDADTPPPDTALADLTSIGEDLMLFAGWKLEEYEVSFDYNYENAPTPPESQSIKYGRFVDESKVTIEEREDYLFGGWFLEKEGNEQFTLANTPVVKPLTLYAKWIEDKEVFEDVTVTYLYNIGAGNVQHDTRDVAFNSSADTNKTDDPVVSGYLFIGWYEDAGFTRAFNPSRNLTEDITVYGKLLKRYTFEAEAVDFTGKKGQGTSTNSEEEGLIMDHTFVRGGDVSNGYFVRELYYHGAMLDFYIEAEEAVTDAVLYLRVSSEGYKFATTKMRDGVEYNYLSDEQFKIIVNTGFDEWLDYGGMYIPMANTQEREDLSPNKTPFENVFIIGGLALNKGFNVITLYVDNNNDHGGTYNSEAPMIDCMYIYAPASAGLSMFDNKFYERENVNRG